MNAVTEANGMKLLTNAPISGVVAGRPPQGEKTGHGRYLWVITEAGVPYILEEGEGAQLLYDKAFKHSNLTGGSAAHCGGELWFAEPKTSSIWVSGGSGRFPPRTAEELECAVGVFRAYGYQVTSLEWDLQGKRAFRVLL